MGLPVSPQASLNMELLRTGESIDFKKLKAFMQCDRQSIAKSQAGFISFIVLPAFKVLSTSFK